MEGHPLLKQKSEIFDFLNFLGSLWWALAGLVVLFPFFNRLIEVLPMPYAYKGFFLTVSTIVGAFGLLVTSVLRHKITALPYWRIKTAAFVSSLLILVCLFGYFGYVLKNDVIDMNRGLEAIDRLEKTTLSELLPKLEANEDIGREDIKALEQNLATRQNVGNNVDQLETAIMLVLIAFVFLNLASAFTRFAVLSYYER